jgi:Flp pilus assembly protein TadB
MTKRKGQNNKQHNDQKKRKKGQAAQWPKEKEQKDKQPSVLFFLSFCCLSFCPLSFVLCVACSFVLFRLAIVLSYPSVTFLFGQKKRTKEKTTQ